MGDAIRLPLPRFLRPFANETIEEVLVELPARAQRDYRRLLAEEARRGAVVGQVPPAARAMERLLAEHGRPGAL